MSVPYYKAFNLDHAKDGAPYKTRDGEDAIVSKWDGGYKPSPILGYSGSTHMSNQWSTSGLSYSGNKYRDLVMTPLGFIDGDPVYTGDLIKNAGVTIHADPKMRDFSACHWPAPGEVAASVALPLPDHHYAQLIKMLGVSEYGEALDEIGSLQTAHSTLGAVYIALGVSSGDAAVQVISHLRAETKGKSAANKKLSEQFDQVMKERDYNFDMADSLANAISSYFCEDIGEHSNVNCPWKEALATVEDASGKMFVAESVVLDVAAGVFEEALQHIAVSVGKGQVVITHGANIKELMADTFAVLRRDQAAEKAQETESETRNPAGFGHG